MLEYALYLFIYIKGKNLSYIHFFVVADYFYPPIEK